VTAWSDIGCPWVTLALATLHEAAAVDSEALGALLAQGRGRAEVYQASLFMRRGLRVCGIVQEAAAVVFVMEREPDRAVKRACLLEAAGEKHKGRELLWGVRLAHGHGLLD
jgi:hypothetical protein